MFNAALSNQFYVLILFYFLSPIVAQRLRKSADLQKGVAAYAEVLNVRLGYKTLPLKTAQIESVVADKPYCIIRTNGFDYLDDRTLKELESRLDPTCFLRVHRSSIINRDSLKELVSRGNGDYDGVMLSGDIIRLSRHYRNNWEVLLH